MNKWNKTRTEINKFFKLKNGQWLKISFSYTSKINIWFMSIVVSNSKRQCNDCIRKTEYSPKVTYGHSTGNRCGIEPFRLALIELLKFEKKVHSCEIRICGTSDRLINIYQRLTRYGYESKDIKYKNGKIKKVLIKQIK